MKKILLVASGFFASAIALTLIQPPLGDLAISPFMPRLSAIAWVAMVPFFMACSPQVRPALIMPVSYLAGLCYWLGNLYWIGLVTGAGWVVFCAYTACLWPAMALCIRICRKAEIPMVPAAAILLVGAERFQGMFLGGFYWRFLGHSQYANTSLIQIADIFGAGGLSFLVAMVNGLVTDLLLAARLRKSFGPAFFARTGIVCACLLATAVYGKYRIDQGRRTTQDGPIVAALQSNIPQSVKDSYHASDDIFNALARDTARCGEAGPDLVVWPETMIQAVLDRRVLELLDDPKAAHNIFDRRLRQLALNNFYLLVGAYGAMPVIDENGGVYLAEKYNSAFLYRPDGMQDGRQYNKVHLVPFGEQVPFKKSWPWLYGALMKLTPYDYDYSLDAGNAHKLFEMSGGPPHEKQYRFGVMICYEDTIPSIARKLAKAKLGDRPVHWLINISNDGWFVKYSNGRVIPSTELAQHAATCVFRAVENRLAVVRSVNTGISCLIDTAGRIRDGFIAGSLPTRAMARTGQAGWLVDKIPVDARVTIFTRYGPWLDICCQFCFAALLLTMAMITAFGTRSRRNRL